MASDVDPAQESDMSGHAGTVPALPSSSGKREGTGDSRVRMGDSRVRIGRLAGRDRATRGRVGAVRVRA
ncbi:hypothetical protein GCM10009610_40580 [Pseudonocardia xinjiangensis]